MWRWGWAKDLFEASFIAVYLRPLLLNVTRVFPIFFRLMREEPLCSHRDTHSVIPELLRISSVPFPTNELQDIYFYWAENQHTCGPSSTLRWMSWQQSTTLTKWNLDRIPGWPTVLPPESLRQLSGLSPASHAKNAGRKLYWFTSQSLLDPCLPCRKRHTGRKMTEFQIPVCSTPGNVACQTRRKHMMLANSSISILPPSHSLNQCSSSIRNESMYLHAARASALAETFRISSRSATGENTCTFMLRVCEHQLNFFACWTACLKERSHTPACFVFDIVSWYGLCKRPLSTPLVERPLINRTLVKKKLVTRKEFMHSHTSREWASADTILSFGTGKTFSASDCLRDIWRMQTCKSRDPLGACPKNAE